MKNAKSFKELVETVKIKYPEMSTMLDEMEKVVDDKTRESLTCILCGAEKKEK